MLHCRDGIGLVMSSAWFPSNMMPGIHTKYFNLCLIRAENFVSLDVRVLVAISRLAAMCLLLRNGFLLATLPYSPSWWVTAEMVVLLEGTSISTE
ncbi:hypothetical protein AMECASPLE_003317 [Ameca splendens]|uniref:Uncharacterized protein n=1 Tax=Ameca splendens TaxID=208324 RepID=A0ABV0ZXB6_9TELE